jgi:rsbT co-antagonist protein RsbR
MSTNHKSKIPEILKKYEPQLLAEWVNEQKANLRQSALVKDSELRDQCGQFLALLQQATQAGQFGDLDGPQWEGAREMLTELCHQRSQQGLSPSETATFVFSLKKPLFSRLRSELGRDADALAQETWLSNELLDRLGLFTTEVYQKSREEVISRQQQEMLELSTPVVKLWDGILAVPLIGTLDSNRTQIVMENLLQKIVATGAEIAIIDITGVPTVDTLVAQHLIKTVTAARLMGADCIISGIRPQIAQTIVHLGVELGNVTTKASLGEALRLALQRAGFTVTRTRPPA